MIGRSSILFLLVQGMVLAFPSQAQEKIFVRAPAVFDKAAFIADRVRAECAIDTLLGKHVLEKVNEKFPGTAQVREPGEAGKDKILNLTILGVFGGGGGAWSGPKYINMRADLMQNNQVIATVVKQRGSSGGAFGATMGTCAIMERISVALGRDIAEWLASPAAASTSVPAKPAANEGGTTADSKAADAPAGTALPAKPAASQEEKIN
jgi:hypothetical protein